MHNSFVKWIAFIAFIINNTSQGGKVLCSQGFSHIPPPCSSDTSVKKWCGPSGGGVCLGQGRALDKNSLVNPEGGDECGQGGPLGKGGG